MALETDDIDASEVTELLGACVEANREVTDEMDGLLPWVGVTGTVAAPDPNKRRVEENSREGSLLDEEYWKCAVKHQAKYKHAVHTDSFHSTTHFSIQGIKLMTTNSRMNRPITRISSCPSCNEPGPPVGTEVGAGDGDG